jgi:hypothetical protein
MPYKDLKAQREYQRQWMQQRRAEALAGRSCVDCGATKDLEIDHTGFKTDHRIWSWSKERIKAELALCVIRCRNCHIERHRVERRSHGLGGYKRGCRCEVCFEAKRESQRRYLERKKDRGADPNRTGLDGFAGRCVTTPPPRPENTQPIEPLEEAA